MNPQSIHHLKRKIEQIRASGEVAEDNTWIAAYTVPKPSGKRYTYYRLMKADGKRSKSGSVQGKMYKYLGNKSNPKYKEMVKAITRRNKIQQLERKLKRLQEQDESKVQRGSKKRSHLLSALTTDQSLLLCQLQQQMGELMRRFERVEKELSQLKNKGG